MNGHTSTPSPGLAFSHDGKTLASASWDQTRAFGRSPRGKAVRTLAGHGLG